MLQVSIVVVGMVLVKTKGGSDDKLSYKRYRIQSRSELRSLLHGEPRNATLAVQVGSQLASTPTCPVHNQ